jgi:hypothetical protein
MPDGDPPTGAGERRPLQELAILAGGSQRRATIAYAPSDPRPPSGTRLPGKLLNWLEHRSAEVRITTSDRLR